jgi:FkbM family methyltransferase
MRRLYSFSLFAKAKIMTPISQKIANHVKYGFRALRWKWTNQIYGFHLRRLKLSHTLPTGITVQIKSFADWGIYNDVFVDGEYDIPIRSVFSKATGPVRILDLGANVGLFMKRVLHIRRAEFPQLPVEIICVEGFPETFADLRDQAPVLQLSESVEFLHGLAGRKSGSAVLTPNPFHAMTGLARKQGASGVKVNFIDLSQASSHWNRIDLLKCDIEGSEQMLFENYEDLLHVSELAAVEFHLDKVSRDACLKIASLCGLKNRTIFHENQHISVEMLSR